MRRARISRWVMIVRLHARSNHPRWAKLSPYPRSVGYIIDTVEAWLHEAEEGQRPHRRVLGTHTGVLSVATATLSSAAINILALTQTSRQTKVQFVVSRSDFIAAQVELHRALCE